MTKGKISDKSIPFLLSLVSLACFIAGVFMTMNQEFFGINLMWLGVVVALTGTINGIMKLKQKSSGILIFGTIVSGFESCFFTYFIVMATMFA